MSEKEVKDVIKYLKKYVNDKNMQYSEPMINAKDVKLLLDYIQELKQDNDEFYMLMKMQDKREYRSKFLKDFQKENGKNLYPDYDEIYKRYDDMKSRIEKASDFIDSIMTFKEKDIFDLKTIKEILKL